MTQGIDPFAIVTDNKDDHHTVIAHMIVINALLLGFARPP